VIEDCFLPSTRLADVQSTATLSLFVDGQSNVYSGSDGVCLASRVIPSDCVVAHRWALDGRVLVAVDRHCMLYAVRLADRKVQCAQPESINQSINNRLIYKMT